MTKDDIPVLIFTLTYLAIMGYGLYNIYLYFIGGSEWVRFL